MKDGNNKLYIQYLVSVSKYYCQGDFWERENGFMRLVRRDYNNIFKKERVNSSGFKF